MDEDTGPLSPARRGVLRAGAAFGLGLAATASTLGATVAETGAGAPPPRRDRRRRPFVLVHGAWHGGWCWRAVAQRLRGAGHPVHTPTLTGLGASAHLASPAVDLETHIADILGLIRAEELEDVVLVGHSYAGAVITGVADRLADALAHLVYLDAILLRDRESVLATMPADRAERVRKDAAGGFLVPPPKASAFGIPETDPADRAWVDRRLTPHPLACFTQALVFKGAGPPPVPRTYIDCAAPSIFGAVNPYAEAARREPGWTVLGLETGHDAMITAPEALTRLLLQTA